MGSRSRVWGEQGTRLKEGKGKGAGEQWGPWPQRWSRFSPSVPYGEEEVRRSGPGWLLGLDWASARQALFVVFISFCFICSFLVCFMC